MAVVACGAIARHVAEIAARRELAGRRAPAAAAAAQPPGADRFGGVEARSSELRARYARVAVGYADCGSYGALDEVCARLGVHRLPGAHCYEVFAGAERMRALLAAEPGTYVLTDYLAASFHRSVVVELGLDRYPELHDDYFGHYRRVVWLAQHPTARLRAAARAGGRVSWACRWRRSSSATSCSSRLSPSC